MSQNNDNLTTQPTATALMERVRDVELKLSNDIDALAARTDALAARTEEQTTRLEGQITSLREEIFSTFRDEILSSVQSQMLTFRDEILSGVQSQMSSLREEMRKGFFKLNNRVLSMAEDTLDMRANQRDILKRLYDPEFPEKTL